jgi:hypothetical protein
MNEGQLHEALGRLASDAGGSWSADQLGRALKLMEENPGVHAGWPLWLAAQAESSATTVGFTAQLRRGVGDAHGQVMGLFLEGGKGVCQRVSVGQPSQAANLSSGMRESFHAARGAVATLVAGLAGADPEVVLAAPSLKQIHPVLPGLDERVQGSSAGLAYALAILSRLMQELAFGEPNGVWLGPSANARRVSAALAVTGSIDASGRVWALGREVVAPKIRGAVNALPPYIERKVLLPSEDALGMAWADGDAAISIVAVDTLADAVAHAFPLIPDPFAVLAEIGRMLQAQVGAARDPWVGRILAGLVRRKDLRQGLAFADSDPRFFLAIACYLAWVIRRHRQETRAPEQWASAVSDRVRVGTGDATEEVNAVTYSLRVMAQAKLVGAPDDRRTRDALGQEVAAFWASDGSPIAEAWARRVLEPDRLRRALAETPGRRLPSDTEYLNFIRGQLATGSLLLEDGRASPYQAFESLLHELIGEEARALREILGRSIKIEAVAPGDVGSLAAIGLNQGLANMTLGGAWLVPFAVREVLSVEPYASHQALVQSVFGSGLELPEDLLVGIANMEKRAGGLVVLNERVFHPRVLWEVLAGSNPRYPAEKVICRLGLQRIERSRPWHQMWSYDLLPLVADARADDELDDAYSAIGMDGVRRVGDVYVQDYAAYGRTNASNTWFKVPSFSDFHEAYVGDLSDVALGPVLPGLGDFYWRGPSDARPRGAVVNARSSAVYLSEILRRQLLLAQILDPAGSSVGDLSVQELMAVPWFSLPNIERPYAGLSAYLRGQSGPLFEPPRRASLGAFLPKFWNPFSWRGIGQATALAYEAVVAVRLVETLAERAPDSGATMNGAPEGLSSSFALARLAVADYVEREYLHELDRADAVIGRVQGLLSTAPTALAELDQARTIIQLAHERLAGPIRG